MTWCSWCLGGSVLIVVLVFELVRFGRGAGVFDALQEARWVVYGAWDAAGSLHGAGAWVEGGGALGPALADLLQHVLHRGQLAQHQPLLDGVGLGPQRLVAPLQRLEPAR